MRICFLSLLFLAIATKAFPRPATRQPCAHKLYMRIDDSFNDHERTIIGHAANLWYRASAEQLCFILSHVSINRSEFATHRTDKYLTIYSPRSVLPYARKAGCQYEQDACLGITIRGKDPSSTDILIGVINDKFLTLIAHELGHVLGMRHGNPEDLMGEKIKLHATTTEHDKQVLNCLLTHGRLLRWNTACGL
jgi:hypothetical protein